MAAEVRRHERALQQGRAARKSREYRKPGRLSRHEAEFCSRHYLYRRFPAGCKGQNPTFLPHVDLEADGWDGAGREFRVESAE